MGISFKDLHFKAGISAEPQLEDAEDIERKLNMMPSIFTDSAR
ncbi:MAG: hypothetical protein R2874_17420 [Desulfobacterales bacterium]